MRTSVKFQLLLSKSDSLSGLGSRCPTSRMCQETSELCADFLTNVTELAFRPERSTIEENMPLSYGFDSSFFASQKTS